MSHFNWIAFIFYTILMVGELLNNTSSVSFRTEWIIWWNIPSRVWYINHIWVSNKLFYEILQKNWTRRRKDYTSPAILPHYIFQMWLATKWVHASTHIHTHVRARTHAQTHARPCTREKNDKKWYALARHSAMCNHDYLKRRLLKPNLNKTYRNQVNKLTKTTQKILQNITGRLKNNYLWQITWTCDGSFLKISWIWSLNPRDNISSASSRTKNLIQLGSTSQTKEQL